MMGVPTGAFPALPPSEVEWEDLLVRIEIMSRALNFAMEGVDAYAPPVAEILGEMVRMEAWVGERLGRAAGAGPGPPLEGQVEGPVSADGHGHLVERFHRLRARNFAMVQRRGVDVWNWTVDSDGATVYQLLSHLATRDVDALAGLRAVTLNGSSGGAC